MFQPTPRPAERGGAGRPLEDRSLARVSTHSPPAWAGRLQVPVGPDQVGLVSTHSLPTWAGRPYGGAFSMAMITFQPTPRPSERGGAGRPLEDRSLARVSTHSPPAWAGRLQVPVGPDQVGLVSTHSLPTWAGRPYGGAFSMAMITFQPTPRPSERGGAGRPLEDRSLARVSTTPHPRGRGGFRFPWARTRSASFQPTPCPRGRGGRTGAPSRWR